MTIEQEFSLTKLKEETQRMTRQEVADRLIETVKSIMLVSNKFTNSETSELNLSQQFAVHRMQAGTTDLTKEQAIDLLIEAYRQLKIKENVLSEFLKSNGKNKIQQATNKI